MEEDSVSASCGLFFSVIFEELTCGLISEEPGINRKNAVGMQIRDSMRSHRRKSGKDNVGKTDRNVVEGTD